MEVSYLLLAVSLIRVWYPKITGVIKTWIILSIDRLPPEVPVIFMTIGMEIGDDRTPLKCDFGRFKAREVLTYHPEA